MERRYAPVAGNPHGDAANYDIIFGKAPPVTDPKDEKQLKAHFGAAASVYVGDAFQDPATAKDNLKKIADTWYAKVPANIDIKPLWSSDQEVLANWDGNQADSARVLASGVSSVGDPRKVNTLVHSAMNPFISKLPAPAYPFPIDVKLAETGKDVFTKAQCGTCHAPKNPELYPVAGVNAVGTDPNRLLPVGRMARLGLVGLTMEACSIAMQRDEKLMAALKIDPTKLDYKWENDWCEAKAPREADIFAYIDPATQTRTDGAGGAPRPVGYKADTLEGVWATAPYLHNGSVPTLLHLLYPATANCGLDASGNRAHDVDETPESVKCRPTVFVRGNIEYDANAAGFEWRIERAPSKKLGGRKANRCGEIVEGYEEPTPYPAGEMIHCNYYDTRAPGNGNGGHLFGVDLKPEEKLALVEYLKTL
jgi:hypothetical protein